MSPSRTPQPHCRRISPGAADGPAARPAARLPARRGRGQGSLSSPLDDGLDKPARRDTSGTGMDAVDDEVQELDRVQRDVPAAALARDPAVEVVPAWRQRVLDASGDADP